MSNTKPSLTIVPPTFEHPSVQPRVPQTPPQDKSTTAPADTAEVQAEVYPSESPSP